MKIDNGILFNVIDSDLELLKQKPASFWKDVTEIGHFAFQLCSKLEEIKIPESVTKIGYSAFICCSNLKKVSIPDSVTTMKDHAFDSCSSLQEIIIPSSIEVIGDRAFRGCSSLRQITIPNSITKIEEYAFCECSNLQKIILPSSVKELEEGAFSTCLGLQEIIIPSSVKEIGQFAFENCVSLKKIKIPNSVKEIGVSAFIGCQSLQQVTIPNSVEKIADWAFLKCPSLQQVTIPDSVEEIGLGAFKETNLKFAYYDKNSKNTILSCEEIKDNNLEKINLTKIANGLQIDVKDLKDVNQLLEYAARTSYRELVKLFSKNKTSLPIDFVELLDRESLLETFISDSDFRYLKSEPQLNLNRTDIIGKNVISEDELINYYKFMNVLGCFCKEKLKDKNGKETETPFSQKATTTFAQMIKSGDFKIGDFYRLFNSLNFATKPNQEFFKFISYTDKGEFTNLKTVLKLEKNFRGLFVKLIKNFDAFINYRTEINEQGKLERVPLKQALKNFYKSNIIKGVTPETKYIADFIIKSALKQEDFDMLVNLEKEAEEKGVKSHILGKPIKEETILESINRIKAKTNVELNNSGKLIKELYEKQFTYEMLDKRNLINAYLGKLCVDCCGSIGSLAYGDDIARATMLASDVQNLVTKDSNGKLIAKGTMYVNEKFGYAVLNDFEMNKKYRKGETGPGRYNVRYNSTDEKNRDLIFRTFQRGIAAFVKEYDKQHPDKPMQQITVGMGHNRLKKQVETLKQASENLTVPVEYQFKDAEQVQYVLYDRNEELKKGGKINENESKTNEACLLYNAT